MDPVKLKRRARYRESHALTTQPLCGLLPRFLDALRKKVEASPALVVAAWPEVVGPALAPMTQAHSFEEGVLFVTVSNSTLYSLLAQHDKAQLLQNLRARFPGVLIKTIFFRLG